MNRAQLEHVISAASALSEDADIVVFGTQSILGPHPDAPADLLVSLEADIYPKNRPERADLVDRNLGEGSAFREEFGYGARGIREDDAVLPEGWKRRLVPVRSESFPGATGWCLDATDLVVSKCVAGREKDRLFVLRALEHRVIDRQALRERLAATRLAPEQRGLVRARLVAWLAVGSG